MMILHFSGHLLATWQQTRQALSRSRSAGAVTSLRSPRLQTAARVEAGEAVRFRANWGVEVTCSKRFVQEMKEHRIDIDQPLDVRCPVRIIHAMEVRPGIT